MSRVRKPIAVKSGRTRSRSQKSFLAVTERLFLTLETISLFRDQEPTLDEVTKRTGLPKSTTFRLLTSLEQCGYLRQHKDTRRYALGERFFDLVNSSLPYQRLISVARPYLNSLMLTFAESVNLGVLDQGLVAHIFCVESPKPYRVSATVGNRAFLHCTSMGKALAAYLSPAELEETFMRHGLPQNTPRTIASLADLKKELERVRRTGVSHDNQEDVEGVECFGSPIFGTGTRPIASMSISGPSVRMRPRAEQLKLAVHETARRISIALGWTGAQSDAANEET
jgi:IclR family transcriptional regulator, KDG regulon repressor